MGAGQTADFHLIILSEIILFWPSSLVLRLIEAACMWTQAFVTQKLEVSSHSNFTLSLHEHMAHQWRKPLFLFLHPDTNSRDGDGWNIKGQDRRGRCTSLSVFTVSMDVTLCGLIGSELSGQVPLTQFSWCFLIGTELMVKECNLHNR